MEEDKFITSSELEYILDVNKKSIEINLEVCKQNEDILRYLETLESQGYTIINNQKLHIEKANDGVNHLENHSSLLDDLKKLIESTERTLEDNVKEDIKEIKESIENVEKNFFRLIIILGSAGIGALITIIQALLHK